ncbi:MAG: hypothetical protein HUK10_02740 [Bacteroides heparinolyticus]|nr:hypothetical protein [Bacteroides heparinolyticus]
MEVNKDSLLNTFSSYVESKRKESLYLKLFFFSTTFIIVAVLYFSFSIVKRANDNILVVNTGGQLLPVESSEMEKLYKSLLTTHCYSVAYYVNSFDINNIKNNQARAAFLVNQADLNAVFGKYQYDKAYSDAVNKGVVYRCDFDRIEDLRQIGNGSEYQVVFSSNLSVISNTGTKHIKIVSNGTLIRVTPRYPENPTGYFFKSYVQEYVPLKE